MKLSNTDIVDLVIMKPEVFVDQRGYFFEAMNTQKLKEFGITTSFVQENQAFSHRGVLRGLHYQKPPFAQGKLVRAIYGSILDIAVDVRVGSPTYGKHYKVLLTDENQMQLWIPPGFAHGALTLSPTSIMSYFCTAPYSKMDSVSIKHDDPFLGIDWEIEDIILADVDKHAPCLRDIESGFKYSLLEG
jgi:dTDP-4-dehydrorhamnose 3,5-epimerase